MASLMELARNNAPKPPNFGSVAGVKSATPINPYSVSGAAPWKVADARLSGSVAGVFPTSVPNSDGRGHEIKAWDTEALRKKRTKPVVGQELLPSSMGEF